MSKETYRFLFVNLPFSGHINPTIELTEQLVKAGHHVSYVMGEDMRDQVENTGAEFIPYDDYEEDWSELRRITVSFERAYETGLRLGKEEDFDCLIFEAAFIFGYHLAEEIGLPSVRLFSTFAFEENSIEKVKNTGGAHFKSAEKWNPFYLLLTGYFNKRKDMMVTDDFVTEITELTPDLNIVYTSESFQVYSDQFDQDQFKFVGPSAVEDAEIEVDIPYDDLHDSIIYVAMGSMLPRFLKSIYKKCIEAFKDEEVSVILSIGDSLEADDLGDIPDNVLVYSKVPQVDVLGKASSFLTHGGMNSVNEAIHENVPMVVSPFVHDQPIIAEQLVKLGLGKELDLQDASAEDIREVTMELLDSNTILSNMKKASQEMKNLGGNKKASRLIIDYMEKQAE